jgi:Protein of unknown function (DUF3667)
MSTSCLNCGHTFKGKFCPECGQSTDVGRISARVVIGDALHFFTHIEKGFLFTTRNYVVHPGISSIQYLAGQRKKYQKPVSYFLIWTGLYILLHNWIIHSYHYLLAGEVVTQMDMTGQANILLQKHFTLFILPALLSSALSVYYVLARPVYNFTEVLVISLFGGGTYFMMTFFSDFILGIIFKVNILNPPVFIWQTALSFGYNFWFSYDLFKRIGVRQLWLRLIISALLVAISGWIILFYLPVAWLYLMEP